MKIVFLGEGAVGKTSLVGRFVYESFEGDYLATIGTDIHIKMQRVGDTMVKLVIWDIKTPQVRFLSSTQRDLKPSNESMNG